MMVAQPGNLQVLASPDLTVAGVMEAAVIANRLPNPAFNTDAPWAALRARPRVAG